MKNDTYTYKNMNFGNVDGYSRLYSPLTENTRDCSNCLCSGCCKYKEKLQEFKNSLSKLSKGSEEFISNVIVECKFYKRSTNSNTITYRNEDHNRLE